jgi:predicted transcriptional regulator
MVKSQNKLARMTIDLSKEEHQKLKALAAILDKSLKDLVLDAVNAYLKTEAVSDSLSSITKGIESAKKDAA